MLEPCSVTEAATAGAYTHHVPYLVWGEDGVDHECLYCAARPSHHASGLVVVACISRRAGTWSGTLSYAVRGSDGAYEGMFMEPAWDGLWPVRWYAFTYDGLVRKLRRHCERNHDEEIVEWTEVRE